jgi:hypothetical protein
VVLSVVALGVLSTGIAYVLNYRLIQDEGPTAASMTNYLTQSWPSCSGWCLSMSG